MSKPYVRKKPRGMQIKQVLIRALSKPMTLDEVVVHTGLDRRVADRNLWHLRKNGIAQKKWVLE